jgi:hypothetical protein
MVKSTKEKNEKLTKLANEIKETTAKPVEDDLLSNYEPENYGSTGDVGPPGQKVWHFIFNFFDFFIFLIDFVV